MCKKYIFSLSILVVFMLFIAGCGSNRSVDISPKFTGNSLNVNVEWPVNSTNRKAPPRHLGINTIEVILAPLGVYNAVSDLVTSEHSNLIIADILSKRDDVFFKTYDVKPGSPHENGVNIGEIAAGDYFFFFIPINSNDAIPFYYNEQIKIIDNNTTYVSISYNSWEIEIPLNKTPEVFEKSSNSIGIAWQSPSFSTNYDIEVNNILFDTYNFTYSGTIENIIYVLTDLDNGKDYKIDVYQNDTNDRVLLSEINTKTYYFTDPNLRNKVIETLNTINGVSVLSEDYLTDELLSHAEFISLAYSGTGPLPGPSKTAPNKANQTSLISLNGLEFCKNLENIDLSNNDISDISALSALTSVKALNLSGNKISDITSLANLSTINSLNLSGNGISDITSLAGLSNLENLSLSNTNISDLSVLLDMPNLKRIDLQNNPNITDYTILENLTGVVVNTGGEIIPIITQLNVNHNRFDIPIAFTVLYKRTSVLLEAKINNQEYQAITLNSSDNITNLSPGTYTVMWESFNEVAETISEIKIKITPSENPLAFVESQTFSIDNRTSQIANFTQLNDSRIIQFSFDVLYDTVSVDISVYEPAQYAPLTEGLINLKPGHYSYFYDTRNVYPLEFDYSCDLSFKAYNRFENDISESYSININNITFEEITLADVSSQIKIALDNSGDVIIFYMNSSCDIVACLADGTEIIYTVSPGEDINCFHDIFYNSLGAYLVFESPNGTNPSLGYRTVFFNYNSNNFTNYTDFNYTYSPVPSAIYKDGVFHQIFVKAEWDSNKHSLIYNTFDGNSFSDTVEVYSTPTENLSDIDIRESGFAFYYKNLSNVEKIYFSARDQNELDHIWFSELDNGVWQTPSKVIENSFNNLTCNQFNQLKYFEDENNNGFLIFEENYGDSVNLLDLENNIINDITSLTDNQMYSIMQADGKNYVFLIPDQAGFPIIKLGTEFSKSLDPNSADSVTNTIRDEVNRKIIFVTENYEGGVGEFTVVRVSY
ncbi:MAG: protein phosphatase 1 regulatory subunit 42 [Candidatus Muirbacterium halophilum]|nr:protein phosphatase 1 regulatory subunit 42 [Candidatus Muirbacterium halophilum]MCK9474360.1 protein phosphatase 1 regulatory subunit 42 [Candidatus Muirbacterium halophilum]